MKLDSKHEAASSYMEAAKCYQKTDKKGARPCQATAGSYRGHLLAAWAVGAQYLYNSPQHTRSRRRASLTKPYANSSPEACMGA